MEVVASVSFFLVANFLYDTRMNFARARAIQGISPDERIQLSSRYASVGMKHVIEIQISATFVWMNMAPSREWVQQLIPTQDTTIFSGPLSNPLEFLTIPWPVISCD